MFLILALHGYSSVSLCLLLFFLWLLRLLCKDAVGPIVVGVACTQLGAVAVTGSVDRKWLAIDTGVLQI